MLQQRALGIELVDPSRQLGDATHPVQSRSENTTVRRQRALPHAQPQVFECCLALAQAAPQIAGTRVEGGAAGRQTSHGCVHSHADLRLLEIGGLDGEPDGSRESLHLGLAHLELGGALGKVHDCLAVLAEPPVELFHQQRVEPRQRFRHIERVEL